VKEQNKSKSKNWILYIGLGLFVLGVGPLLIAILLSNIGVGESINPIGLGILATITIWPAMILIMIGIGLSIYRNFSYKDQ